MTAQRPRSKVEKETMMKGDDGEVLFTLSESLGYISCPSRGIQAMRFKIEFSSRVSCGQCVQAIAHVIMRNGS